MSDNDDDREAKEANEPRVSRMRMLVWAFVRYGPIIPGLLIGFGNPSVGLIYGSTWATMIFGVLSVLADYFNARDRWKSGMLSVWPKPISLICALMGVVVLLALCTHVMSPAQVRTWGAVFPPAAVTLAALPSLWIGKPLCYASVVELMQPAEMRLIQMKDRERLIFEFKMWNYTVVVLVAFFLGTILAIWSGIIRLAGNNTMAGLVGNVGPIIILAVAIAISPSVLKTSRVRALRRYYRVDSTEARRLAVALTSNPDATDGDLGMHSVKA